MGYRGYGLPVSEIVSEGNVGLMQAVKRFDPDRGFRLATYAMWWIRAAIQEYVLRSWSMVKLGDHRSPEKLFFNLRKAKSHIGAIEEGDLTPGACRHSLRPAGRERRARSDGDEPTSLQSRTLRSTRPCAPKSESEWQGLAGG